jgi:prolyl-tRNA synthetase
MRQSHLFTKTRKEAPADEVSLNAQLLIRAGFVHKEMAGVYSMLPLGHRVMKHIRSIVAEEMEALGSVEILMSTLQNREIWEKTGRWDDETVDVWFKSALQNGTEVGFGWSHEEPITDMMRSHIVSYGDMPRYVHQFQNKLRNEVRAKSGIMRCREFVMKDMYSYCLNEEEHMRIYEATTQAYLRVFERVGLGDSTYVTSASGGVFTDKFSHEFQTICDAGEDIIYVHKENKLAVNEEIFTPETLATLGEEKDSFEAKKAAEVGNIFTFGTEKCEQMGLSFMDTDGIKKPVYLGSYGIGITRLMGVIVEKFSDAKGIVWPHSVAPFRVHLVRLGETGAVVDAADALYLQLIEQGIDVLYDDRNLRAGEKFIDSDLIGIPTRIVVSEKTQAQGVYEVVTRRTGEKSMVTKTELITTLTT